MAKSSLWHRLQKYFLHCRDIGFSLDISRMRFSDDFFDKMEPRVEKAFAAMPDLEAGGLANPDEGRMVGHYWLRKPALAPNEQKRADIEEANARIKQFAADVHREKNFAHLLLIGIGGSALGPPFIAEALGSSRDPMDIFFFDNTDPDGFDRVLEKIGDGLARTLVIVISKSGGTKETSNGMLEAAARFEKTGLQFPKHAIAVAGVRSELDKVAEKNGWLARFPMHDWVGGRTSVMSAVGLMPGAQEGFEIDEFLAGAAAMDAQTRQPNEKRNAAMLLVLMWFYAGDGQGKKDMVILPYKVQQLRDGVSNFFVMFIEVRKDRVAEKFEVEPGITSGDYLQGFLRGTRTAFYEGGRDSITLSIPQVDAFNVGELIVLYERAVGFYGSFVNVNAYHQPGVEAGKKAATRILQLQPKVLAQLSASGKTAEAIAADPEEVYHVLRHLAPNDFNIRTSGDNPGAEKFHVAI